MTAFRHLEDFVGFCWRREIEKLSHSFPFLAFLVLLDTAGSSYTWSLKSIYFIMTWHEKISFLRLMKAADLEVSCLLCFRGCREAEPLVILDNDEILQLLRIARLALKSRSYGWDEIWKESDRWMLGWMFNVTLARTTLSSHSRAPASNISVSNVYQQTQNDLLRPAEIISNSRGSTVIIGLPCEGLLALFNSSLPRKFLLHDLWTCVLAIVACNYKLTYPVQSGLHQVACVWVLGGDLGHS